MQEEIYFYRSAARANKKRCQGTDSVFVLLVQDLISFPAEGVQQTLAVLFAADLADHVEDGVADVQVGLDAVVLDQDDVGVLGGYQMGEALQGPGDVRHDSGDLQLTAAGDEALFHNLVDEGHVNVAPGEDAADLFAPNVHLIVENGGQGGGPGGLHHLLGAMASAISASVTVTI